MLPYWYAQPRPRSRHQRAIVRIANSLSDPFDLGDGGPGGWWILPEPGVELPGLTEFSPDVAGWRQERMPALPDTAIDVTPDWICEVLSPSNARDTLRIKRPFYARLGVRHLWYVDYETRVLTVSELASGRWVEMGVYGDKDSVRAVPFDAIEISLATWWGEPAA